MRRFLTIVAVCSLALQTARAAKPAPQAAPHCLNGKAQIEALLLRPASIRVGDVKTVSVGFLLAEISRKTGLSIRFDSPALDNMYELDPSPPYSAGHAAYAPRAARQNLLARLLGIRKASQPDARLASTSAGERSVQHSTFYAPLPSTAPMPAPAILPVSMSAIGLTSSVVPATPIPTKNDSQNFINTIQDLQVNVQFVDLAHVTVGTPLRMALDAIPDGDAEDSTGLPLAISDATRPDFLVEDDDILITTRLKALSTKETHVYSLKNLHNVDGGNYPR